MGFRRTPPSQSQQTARGEGGEGGGGCFGDGDGAPGEAVGFALNASAGEVEKRVIEADAQAIFAASEHIEAEELGVVIKTGGAADESGESAVAELPELKIEVGKAAILALVG